MKKNNNKKLVLLIDKTFKNNYTHNQIKIKKNEYLPVIATVFCENLENCEISLIYPDEFFDLKIGKQLVKLKINKVLFGKDIEWILGSLKIIPEPKDISITLKGDNLFQKAEFRVEVFE